MLGRLLVCWPRCAFGRLSRRKQQICDAWTLSVMSYRERFVEFSSAYALRWNKVTHCRKRIGRVGRRCKWLTVLVDLPTDCSRRLLLHEYNVYLLICFVKSMATHSSHNSYKIGMTGLLGKVVKGSAVSSKRPSLVANFPSDHHEVRCWQVKCTMIRVWWMYFYRIMI